MTEISTHAPAELAHRSSLGPDVTLIWVRDGDEDRAVVRVRDTQDGAYSEIATEPYLALEVYYHPFAYRDFSTVDYGDSPPRGVVRWSRSAPSPREATQS